MSDLDQLDPRLDSAFESLTRDLAHSHGPGAAAAMATARTRRRTQVGAVALATLVVVGGGLTVPRLLFPADGVRPTAARPASTPQPSRRPRTAGSAEWETWERYSPWGGGSFDGARARTSAGPVGEPPRSRRRRGSSRFVSAAPARRPCLVAWTGYADVASAASARRRPTPAPDTCGTTTTYDVDGVAGPARLDAASGRRRLRHVDGSATSGARGSGPSGPSSRSSATPASRRGDRRGGGERLLVAGLRDGWTQSGTEDRCAGAVEQAGAGPAGRPATGRRVATQPGMASTASVASLSPTPVCSR